MPSRTLPRPRLCPLAYLTLAVALLANTACGESVPPETTADAGALAPDADPGPGYEDADWLFAPETLLSIDLTLAPGDWDAIRFQSRNILELFGASCGAGPAVSPFGYVPARVTVDGLTIDNVGLRKKGFLGSLDDAKPSLKLKFDEYVAGQSLTGLRDMTLNNAKQDPSYMNQCLGYGLFRRAGVPAPRCNFAAVSINGDALGIYVHVERVGKPFLSRHFPDVSGNLYEGTLSDFRAGWTATFERKTNEAAVPGTEDRGDLDALTDALTLGDSAMAAQVEALIELESFFRFWAIETMAAHWDGYSGNNNNFFVYGDPSTGRFTFLPWGTDQLFGIPPTSALAPVATKSLLTNRLYLYGPSRQRYLAHFEALLDTVWSDEELLAEIDRNHALIAPVLPAGELADYEVAVNKLRTLLAGREAALRAGLAAASAADAQPISGPLCFAEVGDVSGSFATTYGGSAPATMSITLDGDALALSSVASAAGDDEDNPAQAVFYLGAQLDDGRSVIVVVWMPRTAVAPTTHTVGAGEIEGFLAFFPPGAMEPSEFYLLSGPLLLSEATAVPGAPYSGTASFSLWRTPFF